MAGMVCRLFTRRRLACGLAVAVLIVGLWLVGSWVVAYRLTRRPRPWFAEPVPSVPWGRFEAHRLRSRDGHELGAWFLRGRDEAPSVLLLHGNRGSRAKCLDRAAILAAEGCSLLLVSLRAHGDSTGEFNDIGYSARHDVAAAIDFLERTSPGKPIIVHGVSMGAAAAVFAAGELSHRVRGYVLECPYADLKTAVWNRVENSLPPLLDALAFRGLLLVSPLVLPELERISPVAAIDALPADVPVLILAGGQDRRARPAESVALHQRVKSHGTLMIFESGDHVRLLASDPGRYQRAVLGFIRSVRDAPGHRGEALPPAVR
jgi:pimeloyl-ACP methyl ester carboxylesterase